VSRRTPPAEPRADFYATFERISAALAPSDRDRDISQQGVIGDGNTPAIVGVNDTADRLCFPRFDSPHAA
jgi:hypothetical protein